MVRTCTILTRISTDNFFNKKIAKKMWQQLLGLGVGAMSNAYNNWVNQRMNENMQIHQQEMLGMQQQWSSEQAEIADKRTRALYNDFMTPEARRKLLEEGGLSVGMMYGMGGNGGSMTSGAMAATPSSNNPSLIPNQPLGMEAAMILANAKKTEAETKLLETQAEEIKEKMPSYKQSIEESKKRIEEIDQKITESENRVNLLVEEKITEIAKQGNINEDTQLKKKHEELLQAQKEYNEALKKLSEYDYTRRKEWTDAQIKSWQASANQANAAAKKLGIESSILEESKQDLILKAFWEHVNEAEKNGEIIKNKEKLAEEITAIIEGRYTTEQRNQFFQKNKWLMGLKFMFEGLGSTVNGVITTSTQAVKAVK